MAKRSAGNQITKDAYQQGSDSEDESGPSGVKIASESTLATRKILKPRSRMTAGANAGSSSGFKFTSPFSSTTAPTSTSTTSGEADKKSLYPKFNFGATAAPSLSSDANVKPVAEQQQQQQKQKPANPFAGFASQVKPASTTGSLFGNSSASFGSNNNNTGSSNDETERKNPFAAFKNPASSSVIGGANNSTKSLFGKQQQQQPSSSSAASSAMVSRAETPASPAPTPKDATPSVVGNNSEVGDKSSIASQIKALNDNFMSALTLSHQQAPLGDYTDYCEKYIKYSKQIREGLLLDKATSARASSNGGVSAFGIKPAEQQQQQQSNNLPKPDEKKFITNGSAATPSSKSKPVEVDSDSDSEDEIKIQGPKFTFSKPVKDPVFKFGAASSSPANTDAVKGPQFTIGSTANGAKKVNTAFTWGKKVLTAEEKKTEKEDKKEETKAPEPAKPTFSFGNSSGATSGAGKPAFSFGGSSSGTSGFSFGKPASGGESQQTAPAFTFGKPPAAANAANAAAASSEPAKPTGLFSFSADKSASAEQKKTEEEKPSKDGEETTKPAFSFGSSTANATAATPAFSFGGAKPDSSKAAEQEKKQDGGDTQKPLFSFGSNGSKFSFGGASSGASSGENKGEANSKPAFSFGNSSSSSNTSNTAGFSFGNSSSNSNAASAGQFSFSFGKKPAAESGAKAGDEANSDGNAETAAAEAEAAAPAAAGAAGGSGAAAGSEPPSEKFAGEEDEEIRYNKKCKLLFFDGKAYQTKGLGYLKILENRESHKRRLVLRSEGSNRVIFNQYIVPEIKYEQHGNAIKVPVFSGGKLEIYLLRVKDGNELLTAIEEQQKA